METRSGNQHPMIHVSTPTWSVNIPEYDFCQYPEPTKRCNPFDWCLLGVSKCLETSETERHDFFEHGHGRGCWKVRLRWEVERPRIDFYLGTYHVHRGRIRGKIPWPLQWLTSPGNRRAVTGNGCVMFTIKTRTSENSEMRPLRNAQSGESINLQLPKCDSLGVHPNLGSIVKFCEITCECPVTDPQQSGRITRCIC